MINYKGETVYTSAELAYELGISVGTVNACAKKLFGGVRIPHWTLHDCEMILRYIRSISAEEETKRLQALHELVERVMGDTQLDDSTVKGQASKDLHLNQQKPEGGF